MEKCINQTLTKGLVVIFYSLFTEELLQTKHFLFEFFYILAIDCLVSFLIAYQPLWVI